jgi:folate-dependent phosphoribosylglycinamide formyltransferase PurN
MLQSLIDATLDPSRGTGAEIVIVISNRPKVLGLTRAQRANIPTKVNVIPKRWQLQ